MIKFTNKINPLIDVWLAADNYDSIRDSKYISATTLLKPLKQIILPRQQELDKVIDLHNLIPSSLGSAIHESIEQAWKANYKESLKLLGYPDSIIDSIRINPTEPEEDTISVYIEQRKIRKLSGWNIGGKFDFILDGVLHDIKSTSVWTKILGSHDTDYIRQCSIYRWLNPELITQDYFNICFIYTDWSKFKSETEKDYPKSRIEIKSFKFLSLKETEQYIANKLKLIDKYLNKSQNEIPECTDEDLWRTPTVYKYYANPEKLTRSTKNFETKEEADLYRASKGTGIVLEVKGNVRRCQYCSCFDVCQQKEEYFNGPKQSIS